MNIVLFGPPGAGKGTQTERLSEKLDIPSISSGELFRTHLKNGTELGLLAKKYLDSGDLVPDDVTIAMVRERLKCVDCEKGVILDGFPRTIPQAQALSEILAGLGRSLDAAINFQISDEEVIRRLSGRRVCRECGATYHIEFNPPAEPGICNECGGELFQREDDKPETIRNRLKVYYEQTAPLIDYYREAGLLYEIDAEREIKQVEQSLLAIIETFQD